MAAQPAPSASASAQLPRQASVAAVPSGPAAPRAPFARVLIRAQPYTTLDWYLGRAAKFDERGTAIAKCGTYAALLRGGDSKTLDKAGFARVPQRHPRDLNPKREMDDDGFHETDLKAQRHPYAPVRVKLAAKPESLKNVLLRVRDLERHLPFE